MRPAYSLATIGIALLAVTEIAVGIGLLWLCLGDALAREAGSAVVLTSLGFIALACTWTLYRGTVREMLVPVPRPDNRHRRLAHRHLA